MAKKLLAGVAVFFVLSLAVVAIVIYNSADAVRQAARPYSFGIIQWELLNLPRKWLGEVEGLLAPRLARAQQDAEVRRYFALAAQIDSLSGQVQAQQAASPDSPSSTEESLSSQLAQLENERAGLNGGVEQTLERRTAVELVAQGLTFVPFGRPFLFPPVEFKFGQLPMVLIASPRDRIEIRQSVLVHPEMKLAEMQKLEGEIESQGLSALVDNIGGFSTYPSLLPPSSDLPYTLNTIAHEWTHQYLFLHPLGRHYWDNYDMTTINETVADMVGTEISGYVLDSYGSQWGWVKPPPQPPGGAQPDYFTQTMHDIRVHVDDLLAQSKVAEAESYMEQQRKLLVREGYYIRKLNQAYFAFHGSYGTSAASTSPIGGELKKLREQSGSLAAFVRKVSEISSPDQLAGLLAK